MATKINADTVVGGAVVTADASGILELQSAGTTALTLSGANVTFATAPSVTGGADVVTTTGTQTLTNKTLQNPNITSGLLLSSSAGTSGQVLVSNGAGNAPTWGSAGETTPVGAVQYFAGTSTATYPGSKWLQADGSTVSQSTYPTLFDRIGLIADYGSGTVTTGTFGSSQTARGGTFGNGLFVVTGGGAIRTSTNGATWTTRTTASGECAGYGNGLYLVGDYGVVRTSTDGITWTNRTIPDNSSIVRGVTYGNGIYVYCGENGALGTSTDGITWTAQTGIPRVGFSNYFDITYGGGKFYAVGRFYDGTNYYGMSATSTDGVTWTTGTSNVGINRELWAVAYGGGKVIAGGQALGSALNLIYVSSDGVNWTSTTVTGVGLVYSAYYYNGLYIVGGDSGNTAYSYDLKNWTIKATSATNSFITYGANRFVFGGTNGYVNYMNAFAYNSSTSFKLPAIDNDYAAPGAYFIRAST